MKPKKPDDQAEARRRAARLRRLLKTDVSKDPTPPAPYWQHEVGATLEGTFIGWFTVTGNSELPEKMALIETDSGKRIGVGARLTMLKKGFKRTAPQPGDRIEIGRGEDKPTRYPNPLKTFWMTVDKKDGSPPRTYGKTGGGGQ